MDTETCGCGRRVRYSIFKDGKEIGACNKYMRCLTYEEQGADLAKANMEMIGLQQRLSAAEKERDDLKKGKCFSLTFDEFNKMVARCDDLTRERDEALAYAEKLKSVVEGYADATYENQGHDDRLCCSTEDGEPHDTHCPAVNAIALPAPAALSQLRQEIRREAMLEAAKVCVDMNIMYSGVFARAIRRLAEEAKEQGGPAA